MRRGSCPDSCLLQADYIPGLCPIAVMVMLIMLVSKSGPSHAADVHPQSVACPDDVSRPEIIEAETLDVLTLNVAHGRGLAMNQMFVGADRHRTNLANIAAQLAYSEAHVYALQEADGPSLWSGKFDHVEVLADTTGADCYVHGRHADTWVYSFGTALMSRYQFGELASHQFKPSIPTTTKGFVRATIQWQRPSRDDEPKTITLVSVHLDFSRRKVRESQIAEMVDDLTGLTTPLIILGDFNADWTREDSPVREVARRFNLKAYTPSSRELGTYKSTKRLDWILISQELDFVDFSVMPVAVSDHLAVVARIGWSEKQQ